MGKGVFKSASATVGKPKPIGDRLTARLLPQQQLVPQQCRPLLGVEVGLEFDRVVGVGLDPVDVSQPGRFAIARIAF